MKNPLFTLAFIAFLPIASLCQSQNLKQHSIASQLTLEQLVSLFDKDIDDINDFLSRRGWVYEGSTQESQEDFGRVKWGYRFNLPEGTSGWMALVTTATTDNKRVLITYRCQKDHYDAIKKRAIDIGMAKIDSGVHPDGSIYSLYTGADMQTGAEYGVDFMVDKNGIYDIWVEKL